MEGYFPVVINDLRSGLTGAIGGKAKKFPDAVFGVGRCRARTRVSNRLSGCFGIDPVFEGHHFSEQLTRIIG